MLYCPKCNIDYEEGKKFCKECGCKLEAQAEKDTSKNEAPPVDKTDFNEKKYCPSCKSEYPGTKKFCKTCGVALSDTPPIIMSKTQTNNEQPKASTERIKTAQASFPKSSENVNPIEHSPAKVKSMLKRKRALFKTEKKLTSLISKLELQRGTISEESLNITLGPYAAQLKSIQDEINGIDDFLKNIEKELAFEIDDLQNKILPFKTRLSELKAMRKAKGITFSDYLRFKKQPKQTFNTLNGQLKKKHKTMKLLAPSSEGWFRGYESYIKLGAAAIVVLLVLGTSGFLSYKYFYKSGSSAKIVDATPNKPSIAGNSSAAGSGAAPTVSSVEDEIKKVFETIKNANLSEDINLFMSCYSRSFPGYEEKKESTIDNWRSYDFTQLNFNVRDILVTQNTAELTVHWQINIRSTDKGETRSINTTNNVVLQKEGGQWKIASLK